MTSVPVPAISPARAQRGFSLIELMVAMTIFLIVSLVAYSIYDAGNKSYKKGTEAADQQQQTRVAFDKMVADIRLSGYDYNLDGNQAPYLDTADEQVEFSTDRAITIRANLDYNDAQGGREYDPAAGLPCSSPSTSQSSGYEICVDWYNADKVNRSGLPLVTTANDEIVTYALRSKTSSVNSSNIDLKLDLSRPRDGVIKTISGNPTVLDEEDGSSNPAARIPSVDLTNDNPPYTLYRFTFNDDGSLNATPIADNIKELYFAYYDESGRDYYCKQTETNGTCLSGNQVKFNTLAGGDHIANVDGKKRRARASIRKINILLVGMTENQDYFYTDPRTDPARPGDTKTKHFRKFKLTADMSPPNLGKVGQLDLGATPPTPPQNVTLCTGQCRSIHIEHDQNPAEEQVLGYVYDIYKDDGGNPVKIASVFGGTIDPYTGKVYIDVNAADDPDLVDGASVMVKVYAKNVNGVNGDESAATPYRTIEDKMKTESPKRLTASGYDPSTYWTNPTSDFGYPNTNDTNTRKPTSSGNYAALHNKIHLEWQTPNYVLDVSNTSDILANQTTDVDQNSVAPYIASTAYCERFGPFDKDSNPATAAGYRTRAHEANGLNAVPDSLPANFSSGKFLIFRSNRPNFEPKDSDLIAVVNGNSYDDATEHVYRFDSGDNVGSFQHTERVMENCKVYFYRIRIADDCWTGNRPAGLNNTNTEGNYTATDYQHPQLSPFFPPINRVGGGSPRHQDNCPNCNAAGDQADPATIGYSLPGAASPNNWASEKPKNFAAEVDGSDPEKYWFRFDMAKRGTRDAGGNSYKDGYPAAGDLYPHIAVPKYRLYRQESSTNVSNAFTIPNTCTTGGAEPTEGTACTSAFGTTLRMWHKAVVRTSALRELAVWHDDENSDGTFSFSEDETGYNFSAGPPETFSSYLGWSVPAFYDGNGDTVNDSFVMNPNHQNGYEIVAVQCRKGLDGDPAWDDTIDTVTPVIDQSKASDVIFLPCAYGEYAYDPTKPLTTAFPRDADGPDGLITVSDDQFPVFVQIVAKDTDQDHKPCRARLVIVSLSTGDRSYTPWHETTFDGVYHCVPAGLGEPNSAGYVYAFLPEEIDAALDQLEGEDVQVLAEVQEKDKTGCIGTASLGKKLSTSCIRLLSQVYNSDDFTDNTTNWAPDNGTDCYQAIEWQIKESCNSGDLDINQISVAISNDTGNDPGLVRVWWNWQYSTDGKPETNPTLLFDSSNKPDGDTGTTTITLSPHIFLSELQSSKLRFEFSNGSDNASMQGNNIQVQFLLDRTAADGSPRTETALIGPTKPADPYVSPNPPCTE